MSNGRCLSHVCSSKLALLLALLLLGPAAAAESADAELFRTDVAEEGEDEVFEGELRRGRFQRSSGEYVDAIRTLEELLEQVRDEHGQWDMRNVAVLTEIAAVQRDLGNLDEAIGLYEEAVHVNRVNQGLHDVTQVEILDELTEVHVQLQDFATANQLQEYAYYVQQRTHGSGSPTILPGLYRLANWWRRTGNVFSARALYEQAIRIIENSFGPDDIRLVDALHGLASTYRLERYPTRPLLQSQEQENFQMTTGRSMADPYPEDSRVRLNRYGEGEEALRRVVEIVHAHPESTPRERAQTLLDLADWYIVFDKWNAAFETYGLARNTLMADGWDDARMQSLFGEPTPLVFPLPDPPNGPSYGVATQALQGHVALVYDITARGRVRGADVVDSEPPGLMDFRTRKAIKAARFRPRFEDGEPVETPGVEYRHEFVYYRRVEGPEDVAEAPTSP